MIGTRYLKQTFVSKRSEALLATWIHESLHARQPFAPDAQREIRSFVGYEEGMVEGLTRTICAAHADIPVTTGSYDAYVACYESLARMIGVPSELIYRELWQYAPGTLRAHFFDALRRVLYNSHSGVRVTDDRRSAIEEAADAMLDNQAQLLPHDSTTVFDLSWQRVLR